MRRTLLGVGGFVGLLAVLFFAQARVEQVAVAQAQGAAQAPRFEVDPFWPKPLPNHWLLGNAIGVWADAQDQVWIVHRGSDTLAANEKGLETKASDCCAGAPGVLAFDRQGNLIKRWGGPGQGYDWPMIPGGIAVDAEAGDGRGARSGGKVSRPPLWISWSPPSTSCSRRNCRG